MEKTMPNINTNLFKNNSTCSEIRGQLSGQSLPGWIQGILLYNSPAGVFDHQQQSVNHWMDGLSIMSSFRIKDRGHQVLYSKNYLKSMAFQESKEEGRPVRTEYGTPGTPMKANSYQGNYSFQSYHGFRRPFGQSLSLLKNRSISMESLLGQDATDNCNCSFYQFGNLTMATNETSYERIIHPESCDTGDLIDMSHFINIKTGRPLRDHNGEYYNLGASFINGNKYHFMKFPKPSSDIHYTRDNYPKDVTFVATIPSRFPNHIGYFHTFGMTDTFLIFCEQPMAFDVQKLKNMKQLGLSYKDCLNIMSGERNRFYIVEKKSGRNIEMNFLTNRDYYFFNFVNCYESGGHIIVDILAYDASNIFDNMWMDQLKSRQHYCGNITNNSQIMRFVLPLNYYEEGIDLNRGRWMGASATRHGDTITLCPQLVTPENGMEYPKINPNFYFRRYEYTYVVGWILGLNPKNFFANAITKVNVNNGMTTAWRTRSEFEHPSEVVFVPNPAGMTEDDGILISCISNSKDENDCYLVFINALDMKEVAKINFNEPIPFGTHTCYIQNFV